MDALPSPPHNGNVKVFLHTLKENLILKLKTTSSAELSMHTNFYEAQLDCGLCNKIQVYPDLRIYDADDCKHHLATEDSTWWPRHFIQSYGKLLLHDAHAANPFSHLLVVIPKSKKGGSNHCSTLGTGCRYVIHVSMNSSKNHHGSHYAVMRFDLTVRSVDVFEGMGYAEASFRRDADDVLSSLGLDTNPPWTLTMRKLIEKGFDNNNCGPIACATLEILLQSEQSCRNLERWGLAAKSDEEDWLGMRRKVVSHYCDLRTKYAQEFVIMKRPRWVDVNLPGLQYDYLVTPPGLPLPPGSTINDLVSPQKQERQGKEVAIVESP